jgi:hypothetical protein
MKNKSFLLLILFSLLISPLAYSQAPEGPIKVEIRLEKENGQWQMYRGGKPYYIKGVGGQTELDRAVAYGANSVRTWGAGEAIATLDKAHERGLTVLFGLWVGVERQGFDYNDTKAVKAQLERFTEIVKAYKDHPAILMWGIGNENDLFYSDFKVWNAIDDIAKMIKEVDPNHPTMTVTAGLDVAEVQLIKERAPHIDVYGINTYGGLIGIDKEMRAYGWDKPYVITEWGPNGHWEVDKTSWGVPIEQTSTEKAEDYMRRYNLGIARDKQMCIGSYVFLWGQKQETTPTWYGLFLEDGSETEVMDVLEKSWSGKYPENRSPSIKSMAMNGKKARDNVYVKPRQNVEFKIDSFDPDKDPLKYRWEILPESTDIKSGGDKESRPEPIEIVVKPGGNDNGVLNFKAPKKTGPYRLFAYIYDGNGNAATANFPFYVSTD